MELNKAFFDRFDFLRDLVEGAPHHGEGEGIWLRRAVRLLHKLTVMRYVLETKLQTDLPLWVFEEGPRSGVGMSIEGDGIALGVREKAVRDVFWVLAFDLAQPLPVRLRAWAQLKMWLWRVAWGVEVLPSSAAGPLEKYQEKFMEASHWWNHEVVFPARDYPDKEPYNAIVRKLGVSV